VIEYLFLCQIGDQKEMVGEIVPRLERAGYKPWLDESQSDEDLSRQATFAIERSDAFLILLSAGAMDSDLVRRQFEMADQGQIPIAALNMQPISMSMVWQERLAGRPIFDISVNFDDGLDQLIDWLEGDADSITETKAADIFGGGDYSEILKLQDEEEIWSVAGYYWFKNWRTLTRVKALLTTKRLIFLWDMRDVWKWKPREYETLEEAFPISIALSDISEVKPVVRQKILFVTVSQAYAEIVASDGAIHKYTFLQNFDENVTRIRELVDRP
jgi:hypothetical protein